MNLTAICFFIKDAASVITYFARSKFSRSLFHKKNFILISQVVFELRTHFVNRDRILLLSLNELGEKLRVTIIIGKFCKQTVIKLSLV